jgi:hypothetical protein
MARYRTIKPELFADEKLTACTVDARFLFLGLLPFCDDMGRKQYSARRIKAEVFPVDVEFTVDVVDELLKQLAAVGVIELYDHGKGHYLRIPHFLRHQVINRPGHSEIPPSPTEDPTQPWCRCKGCQINGNARNGRRFLKEHTEDSLSTHGAFTDDSLRTHGVSTTGSGSGIGSGDGVSTTPTATPTPASTDHSAGSPPSAERSEKHRSSPWIAVAGIAGAIFRILGIEPKPLILQSLSETIIIRAQVEQCSVELAANRIAGRAAMVARETLPVSWEQWLADARYDYVPQGDKRITSKGQMARPVCGGKLCSAGWEPVLVGGERRLRRCPDCAQLWRDQGFEV